MLSPEWTGRVADVWGVLDKNSILIFRYQESGIGNVLSEFSLSNSNKSLRAMNMKRGQPASAFARRQRRRRSKWIALEIKEYNNHDLPLSHTNRSECQRIRWRTAHDRAPLPLKGHARVFPFSISGFDRVSMNTNVHINLLRFPFYAHCARWSLSAGESRWKNREENGWGIVGIDCCSAYSVPLCA